MFYVVRDSGVYSGKSLKALNSKLHVSLDLDEFTVVGPDFVCRLNQQDFDFVQDKKRMENLCFAGFFKKDNSVKIITLINLIFTFINLFIVGSCNGTLKQLLSFFTGGK